MKKIFWELVLIVAAVPVFRALWLLLDGVDWMHEPSGIAVSLTGGIALNVLALFMIHRK